MRPVSRHNWSRLRASKSRTIPGANSTFSGTSKATALPSSLCWLRWTPRAPPQSTAAFSRALGHPTEVVAARVRIAWPTWVRRRGPPS
eukprot:scaffold187598_cov30-Tisochrysis_lutea.AAC.2